MNTYKWGLWCLIAILCTLNVAAYIDLSVDPASCKEPGGFVLSVKNNGDKDIATADLNVHANYFSVPSVQGEDLGIDKNFIIKTPGVWDKNSISPSGTSQFISGQNILTYPGGYRMTLGYKGCNPAYRSCSTTVNLECPGLRSFGCKAIPLSIDECKNLNDTLYVTFHNVQKGLFKKINPYKDIKYVFYGDKFHIDNELPNTTIAEKSGDVYSLIMKLAGGNKIDRIKMEHKICGYVQYSNCKIEGVPMQPFNGSEIKSLENSSGFPKQDQNISNNDIIYIVAVIFVVVILFIIYQVRRRA